MTIHISIEYISGLLTRPNSISSDDKGSVDAFLQAYPYFVPLRYIAAIEKHRDQPLSPAMLTEIQPYLGNWIKFCDLVEAAGTAAEVPEYEAPQVPAYEVPQTLHEELVQPEHHEPAVIAEEIATSQVGVSEEFLRMIREEVPAIAQDHIAVVTQPLQEQESEEVVNAVAEARAENEIEPEIIPDAESQPAAADIVVGLQEKERRPSM
jgi:hypothetical protein